MRVIATLVYSCFQGPWQLPLPLQFKCRVQTAATGDSSTPLYSQITAKGTFLRGKLQRLLIHKCTWQEPAVSLSCHWDPQVLPKRVHFCQIKFYREILRHCVIGKHPKMGVSDSFLLSSWLSRIFCCPPLTERGQWKRLASFQRRKDGTVLRAGRVSTAMIFLDQKGNGRTLFT